MKCSSSHSIKREELLALHLSPTIQLHKVISRTVANIMLMHTTLTSHAHTTGSNGKITGKTMGMDALITTMIMGAEEEVTMTTGHPFIKEATFLGNGAEDGIMEGIEVIIIETGEDTAITMTTGTGESTTVNTVGDKRRHCNIHT